MTADQSKHLRIVVSRDFDASAERVFDAWLDASNIGRWLFATTNGKMQTVTIDPRVGGTFRVLEKRGDELADHFGTYLEIDRPRRLVFTFATRAEDEPSQVTIDIEPRDGGCTLTLTHLLHPKWADYVDRTRSGWSTILGSLAAALGGTGDA